MPGKKQEKNKFNFYTNMLIPATIVTGTSGFLTLVGCLKENIETTVGSVLAFAASAITTAAFYSSAIKEEQKHICLDDIAADYSKAEEFIKYEIDMSGDKKIGMSKAYSHLENLDHFIEKCESAILGTQEKIDSISSEFGFLDNHFFGLLGKKKKEADLLEFEYGKRNEYLNELMEKRQQMGKSFYGEFHDVWENDEKYQKMQNYDITVKSISAETKRYVEIMQSLIEDINKQEKTLAKIADNFNGAISLYKKELLYEKQTINCTKEYDIFYVDMESKFDFREDSFLKDHEELAAAYLKSENQDPAAFKKKLVELMETMSKFRLLIEDCSIRSEKRVSQYINTFARSA